MANDMSAGLTERAVGFLQPRAPLAVPPLMSVVVGTLRRSSLQSIEKLPKTGTFQSEVVPGCHPRTANRPTQLLQLVYIARHTPLQLVYHRSPTEHPLKRHFRSSV